LITNCFYRAGEWRNQELRNRAADQRRHDQIVGMMRDPELKQEFRDAVDRLGSAGDAQAGEAGGADGRLGDHRAGSGENAACTASAEVERAPA
jgi:hypothetical protein